MTAETKYCIGCVHFHLTPSTPTYHYSSTTWERGEDAALFCQRGYWRTQMHADATREQFERAMQSAQTCGEYEERPPPQPSAPPSDDDRFIEGLT